ncbi:aldo/keto reductase [Acetobacteraceae bacterium KSS12]|uniref:Aldo/keto reductase n=2 Tax=Rhizosaccharibacter radicis TaxID=2782605 RepID=A0ABT1W020_9PROT|nr:aldo/keto reductase [Acetobacteraceae bacterium KSS12]
MGENRTPRGAEVRAVRFGLDLGMTLIDTAEMYGDGAAEEVVGEALLGRREEAFLVSKVLPSNATRRGVAAACRRSLRRLRTDRLDLYLLHWPGGVPLAETVEAFETLQDEGLIAAWGVSNFDVDDLEELAEVAPPGRCVTDQVLYNLDYRGIEHDLLPAAAGRKMPVMAYSPVGQGGHLLHHPVLSEVAGRHGRTPAQIALAWTLRDPNVVSIPKASDETHVRDNVAAMDIELLPEDLEALDEAFPPPRSKVPLAML